MSSDTASVYRNERDIGEAVANLLSTHQLCRSDVFITTKLGTAAFLLQLFILLWLHLLLSVCSFLCHFFMFFTC